MIVCCCCCCWVTWRFCTITISSSSCPTAAAAAALLRHGVQYAQPALLLQQCHAALLAAHPRLQQLPACRLHTTRLPRRHRAQQRRHVLQQQLLNWRRVDQGFDQHNRPTAALLKS
jgi:hypothetical protein